MDVAFQLLVFVEIVLILPVWAILQLTGQWMWGNV